MENSFSQKSKSTNFLAKISQKLQLIYIKHSSYLVLFLWIWLLVLSFLKSAIEIPKICFSNKKNFLNIFFVKNGWGWTLAVTGSFMCITAYVYGVLSWKKSIFFAVLRLLIGTGVWYFWVQIAFHFIENITGICIDNQQHPNFNVTSKIECIKLNRGNNWRGFDISGHCFLLTYCILFMNSELEIQKKWNDIQQSAVPILVLGSKPMNVFKQRYQKTLIFIRLLFILNCVLLTIWFVMLSATCLYYHTFYSKALGGSCAILSWMVTYNEWFKTTFSPGLPGYGPLQRVLVQNFIKRD